MKKNILISLFVLIVCLAGCSNNAMKEKDKSVEITEKEEVENLEISYEGTNLKNNEENVILKTWENEYNSILSKSEYSENGRFMYVNLNDDDIPELVIISGEAHQNGGVIYAWDGEKAYQLTSQNETEFGSYGCFSYSNTGNVIQYYDVNDGDNAIMNTIVYEWKGDKLYICDQYESVCNMSSLDKLYYINDQEIDKEIYNEKIESLVVIDINYADCKMCSGNS